MSDIFNLPNRATPAAASTHDADAIVAAAFAARLRALRLARGWTFRDLARRVGLRHRETICRYERGEIVPLLTTVVRLADALDVPVDALCRAPGEGTASAA